MRTVNYIVVHNTQANPFKTPERLAADSGFADCPYDYVVHPDGTLLKGRPLSNVGGHFYGGNSKSASIGVGGNFINDMPTYAAEMSTIRAIKLICSEAGVDWKTIPIVSHREAFILKWGQKDPRGKGVTDCGAGCLKDFISNLKWEQSWSE